MRWRFPPTGSVVGLAAGFVSLVGAIWLSRASGEMLWLGGLTAYVQFLLGQSLAAAGFAVFALGATVSLWALKTPVLPRPVRIGAAFGIAGAAVLLVGAALWTLSLAQWFYGSSSGTLGWFLAGLFMALGLPIFATGIGVALWVREE